MECNWEPQLTHVASLPAPCPTGWPTLAARQGTLLALTRQLDNDTRRRRRRLTNIAIRFSMMSVKVLAFLRSRSFGLMSSCGSSQTLPTVFGFLMKNSFHKRLMTTWGMCDVSLMSPAKSIAHTSLARSRFIDAITHRNPIAQLFHTSSSTYIHIQRNVVWFAMTLVSPPRMSHVAWATTSWRFVRLKICR